MSSSVPQDGMPPCFHMMHAGKPLSSHGHPRPPVKAFHLNAFKIYTRKLGLYSHKPEQVSSSLGRYIKQLYSLNPRARGMQRQIEGLRQWKKLDWGEYKHLGIGELLYVYSECFDALFLGGLLNGLYKLLFVDNEIMPDYNGTCSFSGRFEHGFEIEIILSNRRGRGQFESLDQPSQLRAYLGTLLHEMTHAVFQLYCCRSCVSCKDNYGYAVGISGHSLEWQKLAISIEDALSQCPGFMDAVPLVLNRTHAFCIEFEGNYESKANSRLQKYLTMHQLLGLKLEGQATRKIRGILQVRDTQLTAARRKNAADRRKRLKSKKGVQGGTSRSSRSSSRH